MKEEINFEESAPWFVALITLIGALLRVLLLGLKGMWLDETFSVWLASHSVAEMLQWIVKIDQHPPLYYLLLHAWIAWFGETPYYVRLPSVLFGAATIPMIYLIGRRMSGTLVGLTAAVFLAFSPFHIYYGQETRMYTFLTFNASVAIYALVRLLSDARSAEPVGRQFREYWRAWRLPKPVEPQLKGDLSDRLAGRSQTPWRAWKARHNWLPLRTVETDLAWTAFILFSVATMLSHNTAVLLPLATNIYVLGLLLYQRLNKSGSQPAFQAPSLANWVKAQIAILLLWSPWLVFFIKQARTVEGRFWIPEPTWEIVTQAIKSFLNAGAPLPAGHGLVVWGAYALVLLLGLVYFRKKISQFLFLAVLFFAPFLGELLVSIRRPIFYDRTLIWTTIPLFILMGAGIAQLKHRLLMLLVLGGLVTFNLFSTGDYFRFYQKEDWSTAAGYVAYYAEEDDLVLFNSNFVEIAFDYYFKTFEERYRLQVQKKGVPLDLIDDGVLEPEMTTADIPRLISLLQGHDRVWLVYSHNSYTDPTGLVPQTLASQMELTREREFRGGQVQLYEAP